MNRNSGPLEIGTLVQNRYEIIDEVGRGGFGVVYQAYNRSLKRYVAIKTLNQKNGAAPLVRKRFIAEAQKLAKIDNQYVVRVYNTGVQKGTMYFVMEYVPYTLEKLISDEDDHGSVENDVANSILKQVLIGLSAIHFRGWTHRDIKPENILLTPGNVVKLADFGLIRDPTTPITSEGANPGTPKWMAPEQWIGANVTCQSDLYAFGLVAYQLFTGRHWQEDDALDLTRFTDSRTARLITKCLSKRRCDRPINAQAVLAMWPKVEDRSLRNRTRVSIRGNSKVGTAIKRIEQEFDLPKGSVKLFYPRNNRAVRKDARVSKVRIAWSKKI